MNKFRNTAWVPLTLVLILMAILWHSLAWAKDGPQIDLTPLEKQWIQENPVVVCAPDPDFPPVEYFDEDGRHMGLVADYLDLIFQRVGLKKQVVRLKDWRDVLNKARQKEIDLVTAACESPQRLSYLNFTPPYISLPAVIIVRQQVKQELTMEDLAGMKVGLVNNYAAHDVMAETYPDLDLDLVPDIHTGLRKVSFGMVDAMVANIATVSYYIEKGSITNLRVAGEAGFTYNLAFAPRKDLPVLTTILNKGLASLSQEERRRIYTDWIHLDSYPLLSRTMLMVIFIAAGIVLLTIIVVIGWNRSLRSVVAQKTKELKKEVARHDTAKQKVLENETRYRGIFEYTKSGVIVYARDGQDFIALDANQSVYEIDQLSPGQVIGKSIFDIFPNIRQFGLIEVMERVWKTGKPAHFPPAFYSDQRIQGWRDCFVYKLPSKEIVTVYSDETSRILAQKALRQSEEKLSGIIDSITDHLVMLDENLTILWANHTAKRIFGSRVEGQKCYAVFAGRPRPCENCIARDSFGDQTMQEREFSVTSQAGQKSVFWERTNLASFDSQGRPKAVVAIFRDITQRKELAAEAMRAGHLASIGELAAGVAHEINNPINGIINLGQILVNDSRKTGETNEMALRIINEGSRVADIVSSLLTFAKDRTDKKAPVHLNDILEETLALTQVHLDKHGVNLTLDIPKDLPMISCHMQRIQQVFLNLINNARYALNQKKTEVPDKRLDIRARAVNHANQSLVRISFEDNGTGIPDAMIDRVMDPFFSTKPVNSGTGLGLSISHGIISSHGGHMKVVSQENQYTKIIIDLPAAGEN